MGGRASNKLSHKEKVFVEEYLKDLDAKRAALAAGYSKTIAKTRSYQWVSKSELKPRVYNAITVAMKKRSQRNEISADRVLQEIARLAFSDIRKAVSFGPDGVVIKQDTDIDDDTAACISEVSENVSESGGSRKIKLYSKEKALEQLAKHLGLFEQRESADDARSLFDKMREYAAEVAAATKGKPEE